MKYRVYFDFKLTDSEISDGNWHTDYLDANGEGFTLEEAKDVVEHLKQSTLHYTANIRIVEITGKTRELLNRLPSKVVKTVETYRCMHNNTEGRRHDEVQARCAAYATALMDAGILTDRERMTLFIYMTV